ncbi:DUF3750 domain-containing protein [Bradyrhizobium sp. CCBAU 51627]|uniref:DUF3750 domain-containing protein n=1 Tax=Bradyrhizobium sp. CCBAU 51627 TaxID=1325088 RepID=UPI002305F9D7|nr:DUF3750 domain-containing protein [Bradyrhizobium sp. CCBAU 51627]MDA9432028.1 hypothetical protein [Bradyrhizobium sp. CCBAU 51627]
MLAFLFLVFAPLAASAARYWWLADGRGNWQTADRSSAGLLQPAAAHPDGPGPNSNTFVQAALDSVPELRAVLPPTAIGKDFPYADKWFGVSPSGTGVYASLAGFVGLKIGWIEGLEINFFGAVVGFDIRRPALKLPGLGRLGMPAGGA